MTADDLPRYQLGADFLSVYEEVNIENINKLETLPDGPEKDKLRKRIIEINKLCDGLRKVYGPRSERTKDPFIRQVEEIVGVPFEMDDDLKDYRRSQDMILRHGGAEVRRSVHAGQRRKPATVEAITELTVHLIHVELSFNCATMALL